MCLDHLRSTLQQPPPFNNIDYINNTSFRLSIKIMTETSIVPGCEGFDGGEQGKCISKSFTVGENRALILMCV